MVSSPSWRELVRHVVNKGPSERRSLRLAGMSVSSFRYQPSADRNTALKAQIIKLAQCHRFHRSGMIYLEQRQAGMMINHKRIDRPYAEAGQQIRKQRRPPGIE